MTEEEISLLLTTYMYLNYQEADDGMTLSEVLSELQNQPEYQAGGLHAGEFEILSKAAENPDIGELIIGNQSQLMGYDSGTAACTFSSADDSHVFVVYRGTGDGEWPDNGIGMTEGATRQQERALRYFEEVVEREQIREEQILVIAGHSKGGNKAQFVTMSTRYDKLLDVCYNVDGQGFSEKAVAGWQESHGEKGYRERTEKIIGIYGENDYVSGLGISIVPKKNIRYVSTPVEKKNFAGYHDVKYLFDGVETDPVTGERKTVFHGQRNPYVEGRGELGSYAAVLSAALMGMEPGVRDGCAASLMQLMELGGSRKTGLNGEKLSWSDVDEFVNQGIPSILKSLFSTREGLTLLQAALFEDSFSEEMPGRVLLSVEYRALCRELSALSDMEQKLSGYREQAEETLKKLPSFLKESWLLCNRLKREIRNLEEEIKAMKSLRLLLEECIQLYIKCDCALFDEILVG